MASATGLVTALALVALAPLAAPPVNPSSSPARLTVVGKEVFFVADDGVHGRELWRTDGTGPGTVMVRDLLPGPDALHIFSGTEAYASAGGPTAHRGLLYFVAGQDVGHRNLWRSDGTEEGTFPLTHFPNGRSVFAFQGLGSHLYFIGGPNRLWRTDGTVEGTHTVEDFAPEMMLELGQAQGKLFACGNLGDLLRSLFSFDPETRETVGLTPFERLGLLHERHGLVYWFGEREAGGATEWWRSDGTPSGTRPVFDPPEAAPCQPVGYLTPYGDRFLFVGSDAEHGAEVWIGDGTLEGARLLKDIFHGPDGSEAHQFTVSGGLTFFSAVDGVHGPELWVTDGTGEGTRMVRDIYPLSGRGEPYALTAIDDRLFFCAHSDVFGEELWVTDGTLDGTRLVKDIRPGPGNAVPYHLVDLDGVLIFSANDGIHGEELWRSDGTPEGTYMIRDISPPRLGVNPSSSPTGLAGAGDRLFFVVRDAAHGAELWTSDGTSGGTRLVKDIFVGPGSASPAAITGFGDLVLFRADDGVSGVELWKSDGTPEGTLMVRDILEGARSSGPRDLVAAGGLMFFTAESVATPESRRRVSSRELWRTDGTRGGTQMVRDIRPGPEGSEPRHLTAVGGLVYFTADDGTHGEELWVSDGTGEGTRMVKDLHPMPAVGSRPRGLAITGSHLYFTADDGAHGGELWMTDGTARGTRLVRDLAQADPVP